MYSKELDNLIESALADGAITEKEREVIHKRAQAEGVNIDELDIIIDGRLAKANSQKAEEENNTEKMDCRSSVKLAKGVADIEMEYEKIYQTKLSRKEEAKLISKKKSKDKSYFEKKLEAKYKKLSKSDLSQEARQIVRGQVENFIKSFPIPTDKDDLMDFITSLEVKKKDNIYGMQYSELFKLSLNQANNYFPNDPVLSPLVKKYTGFSWSNMSYEIKFFIFLFGTLLLAFLLSLL